MILWPKELRLKVDAIFDVDANVVFLSIKMTTEKYLFYNENRSFHFVDRINMNRSFIVRKIKLTKFIRNN